MLVVCWVSFAAWRETKHKDKSVSGNVSTHSYTVQELSVSNYFIFSECLWKSWLLQPWKLLAGRGKAAWRDCQLPSLYLQQYCSPVWNCFVLTLLCLQSSTCPLKTCVSIYTLSFSRKDITKDFKTTEEIFSWAESVCTCISQSWSFSTGGFAYQPGTC